MKPDYFKVAAAIVRSQSKRNAIGDAMEALVDAKRIDYHSVAGEDHAKRHTAAMKQIDELTAQRNRLLDAAHDLQAAFKAFTDVVDDIRLKL